MKIEKIVMEGEAVHAIRVSNPDKPRPTPRPFCRNDQVPGMVAKVKRYLAKDPGNEYYTELLALLESGKMPFVV